MSIAPLRKVALCGLLRDKLGVLEELRALGCLHLLSIGQGPAPSANAVELPEVIIQALRHLRDCPRSRQRRNAGQLRDPAAEEIARQTLRNQSALRELSDRRDFLQNRIKELAPWGHFTVPRELGDRRLNFWLYILPAAARHHLRDGGFAWQVVHRERGQLYVVVIAEQEPPESAMPVPRVPIGHVPLTELEAELDAVNEQLEDLEAERESLTRWIALLESKLAAVEDAAHFQWAQRCTMDDAPLFVLQAWVPAADVSRVEACARARGLELRITDPELGDHPPTLLVNGPLLEAGQSLVTFYQLPPYGSWDPSLPVLVSFALFFAIILSDAGYGMLLAVLVPFLWRPLGASRAGIGRRGLLMLLAGGSVVWGILAGSYFGWSPAPESWAGRLRALHVGDFDLMMRLTLLIGVLHLGGANLARAWQWRGSGQAWAPLGWVGMMLGGYLGWLAGEQAGLLSFAQALFIVGVGLVLCFAGQGRLGERGGLWRRLGGGLLALVGNLSRLFGDVLSYLRLFALGLASTSLAETFNQLAQSASRTLAGAGMLAAVLILIAGHALNFLLGLMGGVVHGLRLNFIEFYNWGLTGEGYPFRPFRKRETAR